MYTEDLIDYILGEIAITVPYMGSYKYQFGKFFNCNMIFNVFTEEKKNSALVSKQISVISSERLCF